MGHISDGRTLDSRDTHILQRENANVRVAVFSQPGRNYGSGDLFDPADIEAAGIRQLKCPLPVGMEPGLPFDQRIDSGFRLINSRVCSRRQP